MKIKKKHAKLIFIFMIVSLGFMILELLQGYPDDSHETALLIFIIYWYAVFFLLNKIKVNDE